MLVLLFVCFFCLCISLVNWQVVAFLFHQLLAFGVYLRGKCHSIHGLSLLFLHSLFLLQFLLLMPVCYWSQKVLFCSLLFSLLLWTLLHFIDHSWNYVRLFHVTSSFFLENSLLVRFRWTFSLRIFSDLFFSLLLFIFFLRGSLSFKLFVASLFIVAQGLYLLYTRVKGKSFELLFLLDQLKSLFKLPHKVSVRKIRLFRPFTIWFPIETVAGKNFPVLIFFLGFLPK